MGVQFAPPLGYSQIRAGEVWQLFRADYPQVQEREAITPSFETFGLPRPSPLTAGFSLVTGALHDRFWFMRPLGDELIQFQHDRLLHNWRKIGDHSNEYPRFERMAESFQEELSALEKYVATLAPQTLAINQCEISYINQIEEASGSSPHPEKWLRFASFEGMPLEDFAITFREVVKNSAQHPVGRLICECSSGINSQGKPIIVLSLTVRGSPQLATILSALEFIQYGRSIIVRRFAELTTPSAHRVWERKQ